MLALLPSAQIRALFPGPEAFVVRTGRGPRSAAALRALLADTRRHGWARESGEVSEGYASLATAVVDHSGYPVAAVALTFPIDPATASGPAEWSVGADTRAAALVGRAADTISRRIGGAPARA
jgi:DNA-binding IclR family transcriptional regulator